MHLHLISISFKISLQTYFPSSLHPPHFFKKHIQFNSTKLSFVSLQQTPKPEGHTCGIHAEVMSLCLGAFWTSEDKLEAITQKNNILSKKKGKANFLIEQWHTFCTLCGVDALCPGILMMRLFIYSNRARFSPSHCPQKGRFGDMTSPGKLNYGFFFGNLAMRALLLLLGLSLSLLCGGNTLNV